MGRLDAPTPPDAQGFAGAGNGDVIGRDRRFSICKFPLFSLLFENIREFEDQGG